MKTLLPFRGFNFRACMLFTLLTAALSFTSCKQHAETNETENPNTDTITTEVTDTTTTPATEAHDDTAFLNEVAMVNMEEIAFGKLAQSRGTSKDVKDFGKMMVDGHTKSLNELKALATKKGITLPMEFDEKGKSAQDELTKVDAKEFDRLYINKMVEGHTETIAKFDTASKNANDPDIKAWAAKTLPDLQMHLDHAVTVQQKTK